MQTTKANKQGATAGGASAKLSQPAPPPSPAARPARVAVIGAGYFAQFHLEGWRAAGAEVVALADVDGPRAQALAAMHGVQRCYDNAHILLDALCHEGLDLVDLVLPPSAQAPLVQAALECGLPTICQKPFGINLRGAEAMAQAALAQGVPLVVHENFRFTPWFRECRRLVDSGFFGRLYDISFRLRPGDGQGPQAYLSRQPSFQQMKRFLVRETAVHFIDTFRYLFGEVRAVSARLRQLNPAIQGEDAGLVIFDFDDRRSGLFDGNRLNDHVATNPRRTMGEMWLGAEHGVMRLDGEARLWWKPHGRDETEHLYAGTTAGAFGGAVTALQAHVLSHLQQGTPLENSATDYLPNLRVQEAIYQSHHRGTHIVMSSFDPQPP